MSGKAEDLENKKLEEEGNLVHICINQSGKKKSNENKLSVVIYGNCHTGIISQMLESCQAFNDFFYIIPTKRIQDIKDPRELYDNCYSECDVFIHQSIRLNNRYGEEYASENIIARLKPGCRVISIPNVYHLPLCFFPQYHDAPELKNNYVMHCTTFFFRDSIVDAHLGKVRGLWGLYKTVKADYSNPILFDNKQIVESFNLFIDKVRKREQNWDIKVSQFILDNYQLHQLFYDPNHPTNFFLGYVAKELLKILVGYDVAEGNIMMMKESLDNIEYPVCQSVISALDLRWKGPFIRRNNPSTKWIPFKMNLLWYTCQYYAFVWMADDFSKPVRNASKSLWYIIRFLFAPYRVGRIINRIVKRIVVG